MLDAWNRQCCRHPTDEYHRLATFSFSTQMRSGHSQMADQYSLLAEAERLGTRAYHA
jgi:hypothetical protein